MNYICLFIGRAIGGTTNNLISDPTYESIGG